MPSLLERSCCSDDRGGSDPFSAIEGIGKTVVGAAGAAAGCSGPGTGGRRVPGLGSQPPGNASAPCHGADPPLWQLEEPVRQPGEPGGLPFLLGRCRGACPVVGAGSRDPGAAGTAGEGAAHAGAAGGGDRGSVPSLGAERRGAAAAAGSRGREHLDLRAEGQAGPLAPMRRRQPCSGPGGADALAGAGLCRRRCSGGGSQLPGGGSGGAGPGPGAYHPAAHDGGSHTGLDGQAPAPGETIPVELPCRGGTGGHGGHGSVGLAGPAGTGAGRRNRTAAACPDDGNGPGRGHRSSRTWAS